jgi:4a-hydroxytetrahydrobiopterin dehydratase
MSNEWQERKRPLRLERCIQFEEYEQLRDFLDRASEVFEADGYYPDMTFGRTQVCITMQAEEEDIPSSYWDLTKKLDSLL